MRQAHQNHINKSTINLKPYRDKLSRFLADYRYASRKHKEEKETLSEAKTRMSHLLQAQEILQQVAEQLQNLAVDQIAAVVTKCLLAVFGEDSGYSFRIRFSKKRGKTESKLILVKNDKELEDPLEESGGGICDVMSFSLRLACLILSQPRKRKLLVLDESFRHVSSEFRPAVKRLLLSLAKDFGIQIIFVTHSRELEIGKVVELSE